MSMIAQPAMLRIVLRSKHSSMTVTWWCSLRRKGGLRVCMVLVNVEGAMG
jgi:hypothetical protein